MQNIVYVFKWLFKRNLGNTLVKIEILNIIYHYEFIVNDFHLIMALRTKTSHVSTWMNIIMHATKHFEWECGPTLLRDIKDIVMYIEKSEVVSNEMETAINKTLADSLCNILPVQSATPATFEKTVWQVRSILSVSMQLYLY